jgi:HAD superfamily hydrolase (TIGR01509 family)
VTKYDRPAGIEAFLFDLDGTLIDSEPMWATALRSSLSEIDCQLSQQETDELVYGRSWLDIHTDLCQRFPGPCADRIALEERIDRQFNALKKMGDVRLPSSLEMLVRLAENRPVVIVSGSSRQMVGEWLKELRLEPHVRFYLGCEDYPAGKPDPCCYLMAAERLGLPPASCLVFEDSGAGVNAAKAAGMYCVALRRDGARPQDLSAADCIVSDLADLDPATLTEQ